MATRTMAKLDATGLLLRFDAVAEDHVPAADEVEVPEGCDLVPGRYLWDGKTFQPVAGPNVAQAGRLMLSERALVALVRGLKQQGLTIPSYTEEWAAWYATTIDGQPQP